MKVPLSIICRDCGEKFALDVLGSDLPEYTKCPKCGALRRNLWPLGNAVTILLMERAKQELAVGDVTIAILLSSMAVEGEMAFLFFKWRELLTLGNSPTKSPKRTRTYGKKNGKALLHLERN
jgi:hypothetical protein